MGQFWKVSLILVATFGLQSQVPPPATPSLGQSAQTPASPTTLPTGDGRTDHAQPVQIESSSAERSDLPVWTMKGAAGKNPCASYTAMYDLLHRNIYSMTPPPRPTDPVFVTPTTGPTANGQSSTFSAPAVALPGDNAEAIREHAYEVAAGKLMIELSKSKRFTLEERTKLQNAELGATWAKRFDLRLQVIDRLLLAGKS